MARWLLPRRLLWSTWLLVTLAVILTYCSTKYYDNFNLNLLRSKFTERIDSLHRELRKVQIRLRDQDRELFIINREIRVPDNSSKILNHDTLRFPSFFDFLPHLYTASPSALRPAFSFSNKTLSNVVEIVIGVPTVARQNFSYLVPTLQSLIAGIPVNDRNKVAIVVLIADEDGPETIFMTSHLQTVFAEFRYEIDNGLIQVIAPSKEWYPPNLHSITPTFDDSQDRMYWRTKQNLDYIFLMLYCQQKAEYYLQLEDDVLAKSSYIEIIRKFIKEKEMEDWFMLEFSSLGFIGKLFRSSDLPLLTQFIAMLHRQKPVDWILDLFFMNRYCHPEKSNKQCAEVAKRHRIRRRPSLFQHIGVHSSLAGKLQKLRERDFGKSQLFIPHLDNPPAMQSTSLKTYLNYDLQSAYIGRGFFWALSPIAGDYISFQFTPQINLSEFLVRTGNPEHQLDILNQSAEVFLRKVGETEYISVTRFNERGTVRLNFNESVRTDAVKIEIQKSSSNWVIINEIQIIHD